MAASVNYSLVFTMCFACRLVRMADCRQAEDADPAGGRRAGQGDRDHLRCGRQVGPMARLRRPATRAQQCMHWLAAEAALSAACVHSVCGPEAMRAQLWMRSAKGQRMFGLARSSSVALPPCSLPMLIKGGSRLDMWWSAWEIACHAESAWDSSELTRYLPCMLPQRCCPRRYDGCSCRRCCRCRACR